MNPITPFTRIPVKPDPWMLVPFAGDNTDFKATPALAGRPLFLRSNRNLYCIEEMQTAGAGN